MKQLFTLALLLCLSITTNAQVPQKISYQAVIRDNAGNLVTNTNIGMKISLLQGSVTGTAVYVETQNTKTTNAGLATIQIGTGTATTGTFATINWNNIPYFIQIETDITGGTNYTITGTQELTTVPYAFVAGSLAPNAMPTSVYTHYFGELWGGGIVFEVHKDSAGVEHGLIVTLRDLDTSAYSNMDTTAIGVTAQSLWDGKSNTQAIINQPGHITSAALVCDTSTMGGQTDWYLPSVDEFKLLIYKKFEINSILRSIPNAQELTVDPSNDRATSSYWTSTERADYYQYNTLQQVSKFYAIIYYGSEVGHKRYVCKTRAIRSF